MKITEIAPLVLSVEPLLPSPVQSENYILSIYSPCRSSRNVSMARVNRTLKYIESKGLSHKSVKPKLRLDGLGVTASKGLESKRDGAAAMIFLLPSYFVEAEGRNSTAQFGFNGLGEIVYQRTYARYLRDDSDEREEWWSCDTKACWI